MFENKTYIHGFKLFAWLAVFYCFSNRQNGIAYTIEPDIMPFNLTGFAVAVIDFHNCQPRLFIQLARRRAYDDAS